MNTEPELKQQTAPGYMDMLGEINEIFQRYRPNMEMSMDFAWRILASVGDHIISAERDSFRDLLHKNVDHVMDNLNPSAETVDSNTVEG